ncbi:MAG: cation-translocating P-type ATPase [Candidatus Moranbacteria bacterium]|nr:cation-translocating P-type ATPase [Candidatus Moranbacteria bacterium]
MKKIKFINLDKFLLVALAVVLVLHYSTLIPDNFDNIILIFFASIATFPVLVSAFNSIKKKKISIDLLASIALVVSLLSQEWASAVFINLMLTSARIFADYISNKARHAIKSLLKLRPEKVKVKRGREIFEISISKIRKGDLVIVEMGERIPVDGIITSGQALVDQSSLTGESLPLNKNEGDKVLSSTLNVSGSLIIQAEKVGKDTAFEKIIKLVEESEKNKIGIQTLADKFTSWYIVLTIIGTVLLYIFVKDLNLVLTVLLVTCADDIAVAIPMAFSASIGTAAQKGIIVKGGEFMEGLAKVKTVIVDKTGTITRGQMKVEAIEAAEGFDKNEVLKMAATADFFSDHPVAKAVVEYAKEQGIKFYKPDDFKEFSGKGSRASWDGKKLVCGRTAFLEEQGIKFSEKEKDIIKKAEQDGTGTVSIISCNGQISGYIKLSDEIRPEVKEAIEDLKALGVERVVMLTGDNEKVAEKIAQKAGIDIFHANLMPEDKLQYVKKYISNRGKVVMVGDGVNDAASLALSDIGIAMGVIGTDAAIEAADIALMRDDFSKIPEAVRLGRAVARVSKQDFWFWGIINVIGLTLAFSRIIGPEEAAAFNFITDFVPILNSLRLFKYKIKRN